jgi:hypothetical protein
VATDYFQEEEEEDVGCLVAKGKDRIMYFY